MLNNCNFKFLQNPLLMILLQKSTGSDKIYKKGENSFDPIRHFDCSYGRCQQKKDNK